MHHEIERKFLVKKIPRLWCIKKVSQERYFLQRGDLLEEGMKRKGSVYVRELKMMIAQNEKTREVTQVTQNVFEALKEKGTYVIERDSYELTSTPPIISIKKYKGIYQGLVLAEIEFDSVDDMESFVPLDWMGAEVTDTLLGKDARLVDLDKETFKKKLQEIEENFDYKADGVSFL